MKPRTHSLWVENDRHPGDRERLFRAVGGVVDVSTVLYPGSFVDIAPSFVFPSVTYVDIDARAHAFFSDDAGVREIISSSPEAPADPDLRFIHADYTEDLALSHGSFDLLVSLYAGFVSEHCTEYLCIGGTLLVNPSHGDAAVASLDPRYRLSGVVLSRSGAYRVRTSDLGQYLVPVRPVLLTPELLHERGRGIAYTKPAFAYLFTRVA